MKVPILAILGSVLVAHAQLPPSFLHRRLPQNPAPIPQSPAPLAPAPSIPASPLPGAPALMPVPVLPPDDPRVQEVVASVGQSFVFVNGKEGAGSAFLCHYQGKRILFTNQHVVSGNQDMRFTMMNGSNLRVGAAQAAVGHDLMGIEISDSLPALDLESDFSTNVRIGDPCMVIGNTEGEGVIKPLIGRVVGLGPQLVEVSSEFLPGNSGSPIINVRTGRVIGIATYAMIRDVNSLTGEYAPSVRRFGYRIDSVERWQPVNWVAYQAEASATTKSHEFSNALIALLRDLRTGTFTTSRHTDSRLRQALSFLRPLEERNNMLPADIQMAVRHFLGELKNVTLRDVEKLRTDLQYDYFQREISKERTFREALSKALGEALSRRR